MEPKAWILSSTTYGTRTVDYCTRLQRRAVDCRVDGFLEWTAVDRFIMYVDRKDVPIYVRRLPTVSAARYMRVV